MKEPLTEELLNELLEAPDPISFTEKHRLSERTLSDYLTMLLEQKGLSRPEIVRKADLNETYGYQIFVGQRNPSRDKLLRIIFAMGLTLREANRALKLAGANELYCKNRRDAIIIFCLTHECSLQQVNEELYHFGENTLGDAL